MTVTLPDYVAAENNISVWFLPAIASPTGAPTVAEFTAGVRLDPYSPDQWGGVTGDQAKGTQTRMGIRDIIEQLGKLTRGLADFTLTFLPQAAGSDPANKAKTAMAQGTTGFLAVRYGVAIETAIAAAQKVDTIAIICGVQNKNTAASDEFAPQTYTQAVAAKGVLKEDLAVLA
jgi:hypothetical protein